MSMITDIIEILDRKHSWLADRIGLVLDLRHIFDLFNDTFKATDPQQKALILMEMFYCGIDPILLNKAYIDECKSFDRVEELQSYSHTLLELHRQFLESGHGNLDIHNPSLWFHGRTDANKTVPVHYVIKDYLQNPGRVPQQYHQPMLRRLIYKQWSSQHPDRQIVVNSSATYDAVDERLLQEFAPSTDYEPKIDIDNAIEDYLCELDEDYRIRREQTAEDIAAAIEAVDIPALQTAWQIWQELNGAATPSNANFYQGLDAQKYPAKWLYKKVSRDPQLHRRLSDRNVKSAQ